MKEIELGRVPVLYGLAYFKVALEYDAGGKIGITFSNTVSLSVGYNETDGFFSQ